MKPTWRRVSTTFFGRQHEPGTVSLFFDYNLASWFIGFAFSNDESWRDLWIQIGPFCFTLTYWRRYAVDLNDV